MLPPPPPPSESLCLVVIINSISLMKQLTVPLMCKFSDCRINKQNADFKWQRRFFWSGIKKSVSCSLALTSKGFARRNPEEEQTHEEEGGTCWWHESPDLENKNLLEKKKEPVQPGPLQRIDTASEWCQEIKNSKLPCRWWIEHQICRAALWALHRNKLHIVRVLKQIWTRHMSPVSPGAATVSIHSSAPLMSVGGSIRRGGLTLWAWSYKTQTEYISCCTCYFPLRNEPRRSVRLFEI